ncbi:hypothetical protein DV515_00018584 [Chloebia gouldiae]|uniref:Uncharacterized protein n=1 Tax=Chloebia gouldiae TaxID=44316 RepID=A0A3L8Q7X2_CHLGU|nr:hypothetical protein DV515_00018584 [Chloebia gouldiae]
MQNTPLRNCSFNQKRSRAWNKKFGSGIRIPKQDCGKILKRSYIGEGGISVFLPLPEHSGYLPDGLNPSSMQNLPLRLTADVKEKIRTKASLTLLPQPLQLKGYNEHLDQRVDQCQTFEDFTILLDNLYLCENETGCIFLGNDRWEVNDSTTWLTPKHPDFAGATQRCGHDKIYGWDCGHTRVWANSSAMALPKNTFLICGDSAWHGIPRYAHGGPCYLGKLTLLAPNMTMVALLKKNLDRDRAKRDISQLNPDCDDNVEL